MSSPTQRHVQLRKACPDFALEGVERGVELHRLPCATLCRRSSQLRPLAARKARRLPHPSAGWRRSQNVRSSGGAQHTARAFRGLAAGPGPSRSSVRLGSGSLSCLHQTQLVDWIERIDQFSSRTSASSSLRRSDSSQSHSRSLAAQRPEPRTNAASSVTRVGSAPLSNPMTTTGWLKAIVRIRLRNEHASYHWRQRS